MTKKYGTGRAKKEVARADKAIAACCCEIAAHIPTVIFRFRERTPRGRIATVQSQISGSIGYQSASVQYYVNSYASTVDAVPLFNETSQDGKRLQFPNLRATSCEDGFRQRPAFARVSSQSARRFVCSYKVGLSGLHAVL